MKFLHTMIRVKDIDKALDFYTNLLGLKLERTMELKDATLYFLSDEQGHTELELTYNHESPKEGYEKGNLFGHLAFEVESMNEFTQKLEQSNYKYSREPFFISENLKIAFIEDHDGTNIELIEYIN